jgi:hypothetical protein
MKRRVCNNAQIRAHVSRATIWRDDKIFKVNIYNGRNGCALIINSPIARRPKGFQRTELCCGKGFDNSSEMFS